MSERAVLLIENLDHTLDMCQIHAPRATVAGVAKVARECQREMRWGWIVMHCDCLEDLVLPSRSMLCRHPQTHYEIIEFC